MNQQNENITAKAAELGQLIADSPAGKALLKARRELQVDKQAHKMLEDYQEQMQKIATLEKERKPVEPEDKRMLVELQQKVASHETLKLWIKAQADFSQLMRDVNQAIASPFADIAADNTSEDT
ncbi:MAG: hypothetical protein GWP14_05790 [Actinobacteria bacterium]|nr:hypothetical protein [Actinomycetota bacterium]